MSETNAQLLKRLRAKATSRGLCGMCRVRAPRPGNRTCDECLKRIKEYQKTGKGLAARRRRHQRKYRRRREERQSAGTCPRCGLRPPLPGYASCGPCLDLVADSMRRSFGATLAYHCTVCGQTGHNKRRHERPIEAP